MYDDEDDDDNIFTFLRAICLPIILAVASILLYRRSNAKKQEASSSMPGNPRGKYPLLGDTLELLNPKSMASYQVSSRHKYGPVWRTNVLFNKCIFVSGSEHLHQLSKQEQLHRNTTACFPPHHRALFGNHSVLVTSGEEHARLRSLITPALQPSLYKEEIDMAVSAFVLRCKNEKDYFPLVDAFKRFTLSVALRIVLGERRWQEWMKSDNNNSRLVALLDDFSIWSKGLLSPPTSFIPFTASYYAMKARKRISNILLEVIEEEKQVLNSQDESSRNRNQNKKCLVERLLRATTNNAAVESSLTEEAIIDNIFTLVFAGTDTTASVLTSALFELAKNDELRERLQDCVEKEEFEENNNDAADEILRAFLAEVQRCYPAAPFTMRNIADTGADGIDLGDKHGSVPPGFNITYAIAGTLLDDEDSYPNPSKFNMDRWLKTRDSKPPQNWAFGGGCRTCPGRFLSVAESVALLRAVLSRKHGFQLKMKIDQDLTFSYTPGYFPKDGFIVKVESNS
ncbi:hypothetical protein ACHAWT_000760 [Skeletonema menzelii]